VPMNVSSQTALPSSADMRVFLKAHYKHDRFEGRDNETWGRNYSQLIVDSALATLRDHGFGYISVHEDAAGKGFRYTAEDVLAMSKRAGKREDALKALRNGEWDHPALVAVGPLPSTVVAQVFAVTDHYS